MEGNTRSNTSVQVIPAIEVTFDHQELLPEQKDALNKFRQLIKDDLDEMRLQDDLFLLRWLTARDFDIEKGHDMLKQSLKWRQDNNIDNLKFEEFPDNYRIDYPYSYNGRDKDGRPILTFPMGRWDLRAACEGGEKDLLVRYIDQIFEVGTHLSGKSCWTQNPMKSHYQVLVLVDMEGFSYRQLAHGKTIEAILDLVRHYEQHYPETLHKAVIINAPWIFSILFGYLKPIMAVKTLRKTFVFNAEKERWLPFLHESVQPELLAVSFGGTLPDNYQDRVQDLL